MFFVSRPVESRRSPPARSDSPPGAGARRSARTQDEAPAQRDTAGAGTREEHARAARHKDADTAAAVPQEPPRRTDRRAVIEVLIDPADAHSHDDRFTLRSSDGAYEQSRSVRDDKVPGDSSVTLEFTELLDGCEYSLEVDLGKEGGRYFLFEQVPFAVIAGGEA